MPDSLYRAAYQSNKDEGTMTIEPSVPGTRVDDRTRSKSEEIPPVRKPTGTISPNPSPSGNEKANPYPAHPGEWKRPSYSGVTRA